jgi:hypothetical protein
MHAVLVRRAISSVQHPTTRARISNRIAINIRPSRAAFSLQANLFNAERDNDPQKGSRAKPDPQSPNQELPAFNFKELGMSPRIRIFVIACLSVVATVESFFWFKVLWAKFAPSTDGEDEEQGSDK